jgi:2,4-dienoyl-CoA reductase-like NADH-dependent reductase (Old Yellow Enzyme family)
MNLLLRIERHLRRSRISATRFGREAMGDPRFVRDLRNGREPRPKTVKRALAWLDREEGQRRCRG